MAAYSSLLGRKVNVKYRFTDMLLSASGTLVADSGRSIFLEQLLQQRGKHHYFRWEIPYPCIQRIQTQADAEPGESAETAASSVNPISKAAAAAASESASGMPSVLPFPQRPKIA